MRILGFSYRWEKLRFNNFTTFRFQRKDKDWEINEKVQVWYKPRSKYRQFIGIARILTKELCDCSRDRVLPEYRPLSTDDAIKDGFHTLGGMWCFMEENYGDRINKEPMNKLWLVWV